MTNQYKTIYFHPKPHLDWKIPIGAMTRVDGELLFVASTTLPNIDSIGDPITYRLLLTVLLKLFEHPCWDELPDSIGPHFEMGKCMEIPEAPNPRAWVIENRLPYGTL